MKTIIIDTNFLLMYEKYKIDIFSEIDRICDFPYEIAVIDKTLDELKGKKGEKLARKLLEIKKVKVIKTNKEGSVDKILKELFFGKENKEDKNLLTFSKAENFGKETKDKLLKELNLKNIIIATNDRKLMKELKMPAIRLKQKKYLILENVL